MSLSVRLARSSVVGVGLRGSSPRLLSTLSAARRPRLSPSSSIIATSSTSFLVQQRNISDSSSAAASAASDATASSASVAAQATASAADIASPVGTDPSFLETVWQGAKSVMLFPSNVVTEALINIPTPSYILSIFMLAYLLRSTLTFPLQVWQRKRVERLQRLVNPQFKPLNHKIAVNTMVEAKREGWGYDRYVTTVKKRMADAVFALHKKHKTHPWVTMLAPAAVNIPLLLAASWGVRNALIQSTEIANSSGLWLQSFGEPDSTAILPIATALMAFTNVQLLERAQRIRKELHKLTAVKPAVTVSSTPAAAVDTPPASACCSSSTCAHRPELPPARPQPGNKRYKSTVMPPGHRGSKAPKLKTNPKSQIADETKLKSAWQLIDDPHVWSSNFVRRGPQLENVSKGNRILQYALSDRERMAQGLGNFMSVVSICLVPMGLMAPSLVNSYWFASMSFTALQTIGFSYVDSQKLKAHMAEVEELAQKNLQGKFTEQAEREAAMKSRS